MNEPRSTALNGLDIYNGFLAGYRHISDSREYLNRINVFPVPDGDTGNNMVRTIRTIAVGLKPSRSAADVLSRIARLSLRGARGNSGAIMSQFFNGLYAGVSDSRILTVRDFGETARKSAEYAYRSVESPAEGTMLTVIRAWAETIYNESLHGIAMHELLARGLKAARRALEKTPELLQILRDNNVPDAGAWGFVRFLEGVHSFVTHGPVPLSFRKSIGDIQALPDSGGLPGRGHKAVSEPVFRYCTEIHLGSFSGTQEGLRRHLKSLGDSLIVSTGTEQARIHLHTDHPDEAVRICRRYGNILEQKADDMVRQTQAVRVPEGRIAVLTDSIADIPVDVLDKKEIHVFNLNLVWGDEEFLDRLTITPDEFYREQSIRRDFPGSAAPDRERVEGLYRYLLDYYAGIVVLPVARALSGTWQQMVLAAKSFNKETERVKVIDTCLNSAAQGLLVTEVAEAALNGTDLAELVELAEALKKRTRIFVSVSTFRYMVRGGRLSPLKGLFATLLNLKPVVTLDEEGHGRAFGAALTRRGLGKKVAKLVGEAAAGPGIRRYAVVHAAAPERAGHFSDIAEKVCGMPPDYITSISPIVGMHSGKGAIAIGMILGDG